MSNRPGLCQRHQWPSIRIKSIWHRHVADIEMRGEESCICYSPRAFLNAHRLFFSAYHVTPSFHHARKYACHAAGSDEKDKVGDRRSKARRLEGGFVGCGKASRHAKFEHFFFKNREIVPLLSQWRLLRGFWARRRRAHACMASMSVEPHRRRKRRHLPLAFCGHRAAARSRADYPMTVTAAARAAARGSVSTNLTTISWCVYAV